MTRIAIVGSGFSGTVLSSQLLTRGSSLKINLIDQSGAFGPGLAYATQDASHILNVPAGDMSAFPDEADHFFRWLRPRRANTAPSDFVERSWYGRYLSELLHNAIRFRKPGNELQRHRETAVDAELRKDGSVDLLLASGKTLNCDYIVLAVGNLPPATRQPFTEAVGSECYIRHFWKSPVWQNMDPQANILIVGSGLSMVDAVLSCEKRGHQGQIQAVSRRGLLPRVHARVAAANFALPEPPYTVVQLLRWMRSQSWRHGESEGWIAVMNFLRHRVNDLWQHLAADERQRFLRHASSFWDVHRHRMPPSSAETLERMKSGQKFDLFAGHVLGVQKKERGLSVLLKKRRGDTVRMEADYVLDCTGNGLQLKKLPSPLIQNMLTRGIIASGPLEMGVAADADGRCQGAGRVFAIGSLLKGEIWETNAVRELRVQCQKTAQALLNLQVEVGRSWTQAMELSFECASL